MADAEGVVLGPRASGRRHAVLLLDRVDAVAAAGQDLVRIALVADVPDDAVVRGGVQVMQDRGQPRPRRGRRRNAPPDLPTDSIR